jgi:hypothetical protein
MWPRSLSLFAQQRPQWDGPKSARFSVDFRNTAHHSTSRVQTLREDERGQFRDLLLRRPARLDRTNFPATHVVARRETKPFSCRLHARRRYVPRLLSRDCGTLFPCLSARSSPLSMRICRVQAVLPD